MAAAPAGTGTVAVPAGARPNQREHILDVALALMAAQGAGSTSMRQLARECGLNVAAIYHYFPSKADLLRSVIENRQYQVQMQELPIPAGDEPPQERFADLVEAIWLGSVAEEPIWKLLLGEALRGDPTARAVGAELVTAIEGAVRSWVGGLFGDLGERDEAVVVILMGELYTSFVERIFLPDGQAGRVRDRAARVAALAFPT